MLRTQRLQTLAALLIMLLGTALGATAQNAALTISPTTISDGLFAADTHWYSINVRGGKYLYVNTATREVECVVTAAPNAQQTAYLWTLTGNAADGYRFYNLATGTSLCLGSDNVADDVRPTMATKSAYDAFTARVNGAGFSISPKGFNGIYLNDKGNGGFIAYWNSASGATSAGSRMVFAQVEGVDMGQWGATVAPPVGQEFYDALLSLVVRAHEAYDANSTYTSTSLLRDPAQLYSDDSQNDKGTRVDGGGLEALIDGDPSTYWHSYWEGGALPSGTYQSIRCTAPEDLGTFSGTLKVEVTQRLTGSHHPSEFTVYGTNALTTNFWGVSTTRWTEVGVVSIDKAEAGARSSAVLNVPAPYKYLRFDCTHTLPETSWKGYFHLAEFQLCADSRLSPSCPNAVYASEAAALAAAIAQAEAALKAYELGSGALTQDDVDALADALALYKRAIPTLVTSVSVSPSTITTYEVGARFPLSATVLPADASNPALLWASSDLAVATVSADGVVTTTGPGECIVSATTTDGTALAAHCAVTVASLDAFADLVINEVQPANVDQYLDPSRNFGGWVELYNPTRSALDLGGLYVGGVNHKGEAEPLFRLPKDFGKISAGGFRNVWFDHYAVYDNKVDEALKQVFWKLDPAGGTVRLYAADASTLIAALTYPACPSRSSYARRVDGGDSWGWTAAGTPEASNAGAPTLATPQRLAAPVVSTDSQVTTATRLNFTVTIPDGARLYYTTDGSAPTEASQHSTTGQFTVNFQTGSSTVQQSYRFRLYSDGWLPSPVVTRSFIYNNRGMAYPVIAVTTADANINSSERGIFATSANGRLGNGAGSPTNRNMDWERPVNVEYFDLTADGRYFCALNQEADMSVSGGWTRNSTTPPPFKIKAAEEYEGQNYLLYDVFTDKPYNKNRTLQMRRESDLKDVGVQEIARRSGLNIDTQAWEPALFVLNGQNKGYISVREPNNKHFALANYGIDPDLVDVFEVHCDSNYVQSSGTPEAFDRWYELAQRCGDDEAAYRELCNILDVEEYFNYMAIELYCGNNDWPWNNFKGYRERRDGAKFRMVLMDVGDRLGAITNSFGNLREYTTKHYRSWLGSETKVATIFFNMMRNEKLRRQFIDTYCLVAYSVFDPDYVETVRLELVEKLRGALSTSGSTLTSTFTASRQSTMLNALVSCAELQIAQNTQFNIALQSTLPQARLHLNGLTVPRSTFDGTLFAPATLSAEVPEGYTFAGWQDETGRVLSPDANWTITTGGRRNYGRVYAVFEPDAAVLNDLPPVCINEVSASNDVNVNERWERKDWIELYNRTDEPVDVSGMFLTDNTKKPKKWTIPEQGTRLADGSVTTASTIIPAHGTLIIWADQGTGGSELHANFKLSNNDGCLVQLLGDDESWSDKMSYKAHGDRESFGRYPDGSDRTYTFELPSIDAPNRLAASTFAAIGRTILSVVRTIEAAHKGAATLGDVDSAARRVLE